jgi:hypothetical protein
MEEDILKIRRRREDTIKIYIKEIECEDVIYLRIRILSR